MWKFSYKPIFFLQNIKHIMFVISKMTSIVRIEPKMFGREMPEVVTDVLNAKLANKVLKDVGLVISLFDIIEIGESHVMAGDGASHTKVTFRVLVFRPFIEEVLTGRIKSSTKEGVTLNLGFFDDIFVPASNLQHPCRFDESDQGLYNLDIINIHGAFKIIYYL